jgi:hypothetical protein
MATYKVDRKTFSSLQDARSEAESLMAGKHDDDYVMIERMDEGEDFFEPYKRIERDGSKFVLR